MRPAYGLLLREACILHPAPGLWLVIVGDEVIKHPIGFDPVSAEQEDEEQMASVFSRSNKAAPPPC